MRIALIGSTLVAPNRVNFLDMLLRALVVWVLIFTVEVLHGVLRTLWLVPVVGDLPARQIGVAVGSMLILVLARVTVGWIGPRTPRQSCSIGVFWVILMVNAEILLGRFVLGYSWNRIAEDFDPGRGGFLAVGMLVLAAAPWLTYRRALRRAPFQGASTTFTG